MRSAIRVGISGWIYPSWRGTFYPRGLPQRCELAYASRAFNSIEINGTFYSLKSPESFRRWHDETPPDFVFAVKGGRFITHMKRLRDVETPLANFFASGVLALGAKLGPILWQLPASLRFEEETIGRFLDLLPRDTEAAAALAARHDERVKGRVMLEPVAKCRMRHALEVRHDSFRDPRFVALLRRAAVALVVSDAPAWPRFEEVTADFMYLRLHGATELYASGYGRAARDRWARRIECWASGAEPEDAPSLIGPAPTRRRRAVYVYFDNDAKVLAPRDARGLGRRLGVGTNEELPCRSRPASQPAARAHRVGKR